MHYVMNTVTFERLKCPRKASFLVLSSKPTKTLSHSVVALQASTQAGVFQYIFFFQSLISVFLPKSCTRWFRMSRTLRLNRGCFTGRAILCPSLSLYFSTFQSTFFVFFSSDALRQCNSNRAIYFVHKKYRRSGNYLGPEARNRTFNCKLHFFIFCTC